MQRSGVGSVTIACGEVDGNEHAHFKATRQVVNEARYSGGGAAVEYEVANVLGLALGDSGMRGETSGF
jgi:hypothetical protein